MALDGFVTRAVVHELQQLVGNRIHKIHQPSPHDLVLQTRGSGGGRRLLLSANPTYPRVHFTELSYQNPMEPPMFCMLLRKYCEGGQIESIRQIGMERIIHIEIRQRDELGDLSLKTIIVELMGRHSNIILADTANGTIHDGIHHVTPSISSYRIVMPGSRYTSPPEQGKSNPLETATEADFLTVMQPKSKQQPAGDGSDDTLNLEEAETAAAAPPDKQLVAGFSGFSPLLAKELLFRSNNGSGQPDAHAALLENEAALERLWPVFDSFINAARDHDYEPNIVEKPDGKALFSVTPLTHAPGETRVYSTISECLEAFYGDKASRDTVKQRVSDMLQFLNNERAKNAKKLDKQAATLEEAKEAEKYRILGELLTTYMHSFQKGDRSVEVVNYYDENGTTVAIELDPQLSPSENAQRYFRRYTKARNSTGAVLEQMELAREEIRYLDSLLQQLGSASIQDVEEIRDELVAGGYLRARVKRGAKRKKPTKPALLCYTSSEGIPIYVGKNNTQNEYLTNRLAASGDTWLHTKDIPGSHVVIRSQQFGDATLEEAAMLAAHYSQASGSSMVPVDHTLIRHVHKPSGAKPGFVIYDRQKTVFITPDEDRIKSLPSEIKS
ncbi:NFACT family protein [Paenibacillus pasadenensis]|uniref:Rqc2 family fibronectin-binding protein n=1 Tax=Paenibacillus pasadenensis TaxID=217090 RepID=UPI00203EFCAB|nr:NFACT RNA binding domain-containing protein [Paenibacillus pasadenensis]MCM3746159.1 NFACT family protein [Paenibacillus pasadenensis]